MKKLSIIISSILLCETLHAQDMKAYWYEAEGDHYYQVVNAVPHSGAAFYSSHGGGKILHKQAVNKGGSLLYQAKKKPTAFVLNTSDNGIAGTGTVVHFYNKEFTVKNIQIEKQNSRNVLQWEAGVAHLPGYEMVVLKSVEGTHFKEETIIEPHSKELTSYSWTDENSTSATSHYQLQMRGKKNDLNFTSRVLSVSEGVALVYPTLVTDFVHIDLKDSKTSTYRLTNLQGQLIQEGALLSKQNTISLKELSAGVYFISIHTTHGSFTQKLVRE